MLDYTKLTHRYSIRSAPHEYNNNYNYYTFTIFILLGYRVLQLFLHQLHATAIAGQSWKVANSPLLRHHYALYHLVPCARTCRDVFNRTCVAVDRGWPVRNALAAGQGGHFTCRSTGLLYTTPNNNCYTIYTSHILY